MLRLCCCQIKSSVIAFGSAQKSPALLRGSGARLHRGAIVKSHTRRLLTVKAVEEGRTYQLDAPVPSKVLESINDATKWTVVVAVTATVGIRHDAVSLWCVIGSVIAAAVSKALKVVINQQRPPHARAVSPGMPSSHATSLSFLASYTASALALQPHAAPAHQSLAAGIMLAAAFLAWLRVHTGYHTGSQTVAGFSLGSTSAGCWLKLYDAFVAEWCRQRAWHFHLIVGLAAAAAAAFVCKLIRKPEQ